MPEEWCLMVSPRGIKALYFPEMSKIGADLEVSGLSRSNGCKSGGVLETRDKL